MKPSTQPKRKTRHTPQERKTLLSQYNKLRKKGETAQNAALMVKVPYITLQTWHKKVEALAQAKVQASKGTTAKKAKKVTQKAPKRAQKAAQGITITLQSGVVVTCASASDAASILKELK